MEAVSYSGCWLRRSAGRGWLCFPLYAAQAPGCSIWSVPGAARGSSHGVFQKSADSAAPAFCAFPVRAAQAARSLTGALSPVRSAFCPPWSQPQFLPAGWMRAPLSLAATLPRMSTIQNLRKSLVRNWRPVCSLVGGAVSGAEFAPFPSPLPPASGGGWSAAG